MAHSQIYSKLSELWKFPNNLDIYPQLVQEFLIISTKKCFDHTHTLINRCVSFQCNAYTHTRLTRTHIDTVSCIREQWVFSVSPSHSTANGVRSFYMIRLFLHSLHWMSAVDVSKCSVYYDRFVLVQFECMCLSVYICLCVYWINRVAGRLLRSLHFYSAMLLRAWVWLFFISTHATCGSTLSLYEIGRISSV